ncbi:MAG: type 1 glutamine amidotransferase [Pseudomonadota bacterium]
MPKRIAVFQHLAVEHPGIFRDFLHADNVVVETFELDEGASIPSLKQFDALWVMGGPMDVWQENEHPWLAAEKAAIRQAVCDENLPFLGVCLGHQLFAEALGGSVKLGGEAEVGVHEVALTDSGKAHPVFQGFVESFQCLQWHSAEVAAVPAALSILASSPACEVQALARQANQVSIQFHIEVTQDTVGEWAAVPAYEASLQQALGKNGLDIFSRATSKHLATFNQIAEQFYRNWKDAANF